MYYNLIIILRGSYIMSLSTKNHVKIKDLLIESREELLYIKTTIGLHELSEEESAGLKNILNTITLRIDNAIDMVNLNTRNN